MSQHTATRQKRSHGRSHPVTIYDEWVAGLRPACPPGFWRNPDNARAVLEELWRREEIVPDEVPRRCDYQWYRQRVHTLLNSHRASPFALLNTLYPGRWQREDFPRRSRVAAGSAVAEPAT